MKPGYRLAGAVALVATLVLGYAVPALAFGGGVGGGSRFGSGGSGGGGGGGVPIGGGGFPMPIFFPFFGFGGGLLPILLILFFFWLSRQASSAGGGTLAPVRPSEVNLIRLEIALLATAKDVPAALHRLVASIDTSTESGLSQLLQEAALLLLRHQQYWHAASYEVRKVRYAEAEPAFNNLTMQARAKLSYETISNVGGVKQLDTEHQPASAEAILPGDYIVVVLIVATSAPLRLRPARTADEIREQLAEIAAAAGSDLEGVEVVWQPDSAEESLSRDDLVTMYPELTPI